jgi:serine protease Do
MAATTWKLWIAVTLVGCWLLPLSLGDPPQSSKGTPTDVASLKDMEQRVRAAAKKVMPSVVAIEGAQKLDQPGPKHHDRLASGVIITADGLILSQYHVSHLLDRNNYEKSRKPGERVKVILYDGRECDAELLGADRANDLSLLRLVKPGPYPFAPLDEKVTVKLGEGVLKLGHPMGYRRGRAPVVRLGRVLCAHEDSFVSDCLVTGGDSGGPLFDLEGRLVGIVRSSGIPQPLREAAGTAQRIDMLFACSTNALVQSRLAAMRRGEFPVYDKDAMGHSMEGFAKAKLLPVEHWSQGAAVKTAYRDAVKQARPGVVAVRDGDGVVALGTVVGADGWIVTKASLLPAEPRCELPDGKVVAAKVVGVDPAFDVALLKVPATGLHEVEWVDKPDPAAGTFLAVPGLQELPLAVGVVSVPRRDLEGPFPTRIDPPRKQPAVLPEVIGSAVQGRGYWVEFVEGKAAAAGIQPGDVILTIADKAVRRHQDLADCVKGHFAGERVPVRVYRAGKTLEFTMSLRAEGQSAPFSSRADDFPMVFEHDAPVLASECGGPVVDLAGKTLGITIARVGPHGCMAIPGDCIRLLLPDLKAGKRADNWTAYLKALAARAGSPASTDPKPGMPVTVTLDELKGKLKERGERFKSLLVEYDLVTDAHVEPKLLMSWDLHTIRDYQEQHRVAFAGAKRYTQVVRPEVLLKYAPEDQVTADPNAPPEVAKAIEQRRLAATRRKAEGSLGHLFARQRGEEIRSIFDGGDCFLWDDSRKRMVKCQPGDFYSPLMYLAGLGLRPVDPEPGAERRQSQQAFWFPENFTLYEMCRVLPTQEAVEGGACCVVEAEYHQEWDGKRHTITDKIWFDPELGFALRKWEQRVDGLLASLRTNTKFEEFAPGCWLPWESTWTVGTPGWVAPELRDRPAYSYNMRLRKVRVNDVSGDLFRP